MKLSFIVRDDEPQLVGPCIIPINAETGEKIEGVIASSVSCAVEEITTMTLTVYVYQHSNEPG